MKNICFFTPHYDPARHVLMTYYEKILPKDISISLFTLENPDERYSFNRTKIFHKKIGKSQTPKELRKFCKEENIDLLINLAGTVNVALAMSYAKAFTKTKMIFYIQGNPKVSFENIGFLLVQFFADRILACSKAVSERFKKFLFLSSHKIFYLANPINVHIFHPKSKLEVRKNIGIGKSEKVLIYIGRIEPQQGSDYLLPLIKNNQDKKFILIGKVKDKNFEKLNLKNLKLIPFIPNTEVSDYYNASDLSIFLSKRNSYPFPPRESLACGIPVIVFDIDSFKFVKTNAIMKVPFNILTIQKKIDEFFSLSENERKILGKEGREFIVKDSSEEQITPLTKKYFLDLLD